MRLAAVLVLLASAPVAAAPCSVTVVRAPDDVREVVDHWVSAEPRCATTLEVRIVPSGEGLFVIARDDRGRVHDRMVPDAQTAGVLIASWAADDDVGLPPVVAPSADPDVPAPSTPFARARREHRWLRAGSFVPLATAMLGAGYQRIDKDTATGARGSVGLWTRGGWTLDATLAVQGSTPFPGYNRPSDGLLSLFYADAIANLGYVLRVDRFSLTPSLGLGGRYATFDYGLAVPPAGMTFKHESVMWISQVAITAAYDILPRLQVTFGPVLTAYPDPWRINQNAELVLAGGVGWAM
jgi:hypothetical protein